MIEPGRIKPARFFLSQSGTPTNRICPLLASLVWEACERFFSWNVGCSPKTLSGPGVPRVPDGGITAVLLGVALGALGMARCFAIG